MAKKRHRKANNRPKQSSATNASTNCHEGSSPITENIDTGEFTPSNTQTVIDNIKSKQAELVCANNIPDIVASDNGELTNGALSDHGLTGLNGSVEEEHEENDSDQSRYKEHVTSLKNHQIEEGILHNGTHTLDGDDLLFNGHENGIDKEKEVQQIDNSEQSTSTPSEAIEECDQSGPNSLGDDMTVELSCFDDDEHLVYTPSNTLTKPSNIEGAYSSEAFDLFFSDECDEPLDSNDDEDLPADKDLIPTSDTTEVYEYVRGIWNHGNTCFMNASLQALYAIPALRQYFLEYHFRRLREQSKAQISECFTQFVHAKMTPPPKMNDPISGAVSVSFVNAVWQKFKLRPYHQHDAQEFLRFLLNTLHDELKSFHRVQDPASDEQENKPFLKESRELLSLKRRSSTEYQDKLYEFYVKTSDFVDDLPQKVQPSSKSTKMNYRSIISDIFNGKLRNTVTCLNCGHQSQRIELFQDLSIPVTDLSDHNQNPFVNPKLSKPGATNWLLSVMNSLRHYRLDEAIDLFFAVFAYLVFFIQFSSIKGSRHRIEDCLAKFFSTETLTGANKFKCDKCETLTDCEKQMQLTAFPDVLPIHLNRYANNHGHFSKLSSAIEFPLTSLDMTPYAAEGSEPQSRLYDLIAVVCHAGVSMTSGHYVCYALNDFDQEWYLYDDAKIYQVDTETLAEELATTAYILFYKKSTFVKRSNNSQSTSFIQHTRDVCYDLEEIFLRSQPTIVNIEKRYDFLLDNAITSYNEYLTKRFATVPTGLNRDAVYVSRYWLNLFIHSESPGRFDNSEAFCPHNKIRQTEWLFFSQHVAKLIKPVGYFLRAMFSDGFCYGRMDSSPQSPICETCLEMLLELEMFRHQQADRLNIFDFQQRHYFSYGLFSGIATISYKEDSSYLNSLVTNNTEERTYLVSYEFMVSLQNFLFFQQFGKMHSPTDYNQMIALVEKAARSTSEYVECLKPPSLISSNSRCLRLPFLPLNAILRIGQQRLQKRTMYNDKTKNEIVQKHFFDKMLEQIDFDHHCLIAPKTIDNWEMIGMKDKINKHLANVTLPADTSSSQYKQRFTKELLKALGNKDYRFQRKEVENAHFTKDLNYFGYLVNEDMWQILKQTYGCTLQISNSADYMESSRLVLEIDAASVEFFHDHHYMPFIEKHRKEVLASKSKSSKTK